MKYESDDVRRRFCFIHVDVDDLPRRKAHYGAFLVVIMFAPIF